MTFILPFLFIFGAIIGSFVNVLIDRLPGGENFWSVRSRCESCNKRLKPLDLIPIISFILLQGKCRYCHAKIPPRIFIVELISGLLFMLLWLLFPMLDLFTVSAVISLTLLAIFFIDLEQGVIPDILIFLFLLLAVLWAIFTRGVFLEHAASAVGAFLFFGTIFALTRGRGMGFGDVKLAIPLGLLLGFPSTVFAVYIAFLTGAVIALILVAAGKKKFHGSTIPFGPFLCIGIFAMFTAGPEITNFVLSFLNL